MTIYSLPKDVTRCYRNYCYIVERGGLYKIGHTGNLVTRLQALDSNDTKPLTVVHLIEHSFCNEIERGLHRLFARKRMKGEWFSLNQADIAAIKAMSDRDILSALPRRPSQFAVDDMVAINSGPLRWPSQKT